MGYPVKAGNANYSSTGSGNTSKFIPQLYSGKLVEKFYDATVFGDIANTDYEGEIKAHGDEVIIRTVASITITDYVKGTKLDYEQPESPDVSLKINKGKAFSFELKLVDEHQSDLNLMNTWSEDGGNQMKVSVDTDVLGAVYTSAHATNSGDKAGKTSGDIKLGTSGAPLALDKSNILDALVDYGTVLDEHTVPEASRWVVLPPKACGLIKKSDLRDASISGDGTSLLRNGRLGMIDRFTIYNSNLLNVSARKYDIIFGHKSAITFAGQITHMEKLKNPDDFGELCRSLFVFGFEVIKPESLGHSVVTIN